MELTASELRDMILAEAQKIENEGATRLEEEAVSLDIETLRSIIQEEAQLFEEGAKMSEMDVYEEGDVDMSEGHGEDSLSDTHRGGHGEMANPELNYDAGMDEEALEEDSFRREMDHDDADIDHLRRIRDELNAHIHNLEMQDDRAHERDPSLHEEELPAELSEEEADEGHCGGKRMEEEMIDEGEHSKLKPEDKKRLEKMHKDGELTVDLSKHFKDDGTPKGQNESVEAENLNESADLANSDMLQLAGLESKTSEDTEALINEATKRPNPEVSRWMQIAGL